MICIYGVRHDKTQGVLIETLTNLNSNDVFFFKNNDQPFSRHCEQIQNIVKAANVKRAKKIRIDLSTFSYEYFEDNIAVFRGTKLKSVNQQIEKVYLTKLNKEMGAIKRRQTIAAKKQAKIDEASEITANKQAKIDEASEIKFQLERAKQISEMFDGLQAPSTSGGSGGFGSGRDSAQGHGSGQLDGNAKGHVPRLSGRGHVDQELRHYDSDE